MPHTGHYSWEVLEDGHGHAGSEGYSANQGEEEAWQPELEELQISLYDLEPDWIAQPQVPLERQGRTE